MTASAMDFTHTHTHARTVDDLINLRCKIYIKKDGKLRFRFCGILTSADISQLEDFQMTPISSLIYTRFPHTKTRRTASLLRVFCLL